MAEIGAEGILQMPQVKEEKNKKETFGTPVSPTEWVERTENSSGLKNYLTFGRRMQMLVRASLGDEKKAAGSFNAFREWVKVKSDPDKYYQSLGAEFKQAGIEEKSVMDMGAGAGAIFGLFEKTGVFPKKLVMVEPNTDYYEFINERIGKMCEDGEKRSADYELADSSDVEGSDGHRIYKIKSKKTGQEFEIETMNRLAGKDSINLSGDGKVDAITFSGVAKYYEPDDFRNITESLRPVLKEGGNIAFSFTLEDAPSLDAKVHKMLKGDKPKHPYTQRDMENLFSRRCEQSYGDNYVCRI